MSVYIGDRVSLGIGREQTRGTGVSPNLWIPAATFDFQQRINIQNIAGMFGKIISTEDTKVLQQYGQGTIGMDLRARAVGYFLLQLFGDYSTASSGGAYVHTFSMTHSNQHPTVSITIKDPNKCERFIRSSLESMTINFTPDAVSTIETSFMSEQPSDQTETPDFTTQDYVFAPSTLTVKTAANQASLDAAQATVVNNFSITFEKGSDPDFGSGDTSPADVYNLDLKISGSFERVFDGDTEHDYVFNNTQRALRFDANDTAVTIGASETPQLKLDLYNVHFTNHTVDRPLGGIVRQTVEFVGHLNLSDGNVMTAELTNDLANYDS